jgi:type IV pilus assembly protein PilN
VIRTNLSTRPFYNERVIHLWLAVIAAVTIAATVFNVTRVIRYSRSDTRLATAASRDEARAADLREQAARLRATVDPKQVERASQEARVANDLIDRRTFSWTELLNRFEKTLPDDVRITAVRPSIDRRLGTMLTINVVARSTDDVAQFMENLEATGAFASLRASEDHPNEHGEIEATLATAYRPAAAHAPAAAQATGAARR